MEAQSGFVDKFRNFVKYNNLIVNVVVHPNKQGEVGGTNDVKNVELLNYIDKAI